MIGVLGVRLPGQDANMALPLLSYPLSDVVAGEESINATYPTGSQSC